MVIFKYSSFASNICYVPTTNSNQYSKVILLIINNNNGQYNF